MFILWLASASPGFHPAAGISRTDGIGPADPQQNPDDNVNLPVNDLP
jgi:hypothetical protein